MALIQKCFILIAILLVCFQSYGQDIVVNDAFQNVYISSSAKISSSILSAQDLYSEDRFKPQQDFSFNISQHSEPFWIKFNVKNASSHRRNLYLELTNPNINHGRLYALRDSQVILLYDFGVKYPFPQRPVSHNNFLLPIILDSMESTTFCVEILPGMFSNNFDLILWNKKSREDYRNKEFLFFCIFQVVHFLFIIVLGAVMYITRQIRQWLIIINSSLGVVYKYIDIGLGYMYIWPHSPEMQKIALTVIVNILAIASIFFIRKYLNTKGIAPLLDKIYIHSSWILAAIIVLNFLNLFVDLRVINYLKYVNSGVLLTVTCIYVYNILSYLKTRVALSECIFFIVCFAPMTFVTLIFFFKQLNLYHINLSFLARNPIFLISLSHGNLFVWAIYWIILFVSLLMMFRLNNLFKENQSMYEILELERKESVKQLMHSIETERKRVAQELHDGSGVSLSAIRMKMTHLKELIKDKVNGDKLTIIMQDIDHLSKEIREISHLIMPISLSKLGLKAGIKELIGKLNQSNAETEFNLFQQYNEERLTQNHQINIYRICQELLNNAIKHSKATQVTLNLVEDDDVLSISMEDNGVGFDTHAESKGLGMNNIHLRTGLMQGTLHMDSNEQSGSFFNIHIPIK
jgi:signal transduction histidine kinase